MSKKVFNYKGISFYNSSFSYILNKINKGGVLVAPAASALSQIYDNKNYYLAIKKADIAILDSGLFCILVRIFLKMKVKKLSGYLFLKKLLDSKKIKNKKILLVNPSKLDNEINKELLLTKGFKKVESYLAPKYNNKVTDKKLLKQVKKFKPNYLIINIGGGTQEQLGIYIKNNIKYKLSIICTGAAIAFLTKRQAPINDFVDKIYLGWLWRIIYDPKRFFFRTMSSLGLIKIFFRE